MKKKANIAILVACMLVVFSVGALAVTLVQRSEASAVKGIADQALGEAYGLTAQTLGLFAKEVSDAGGTWTVEYIPDGYAPVLLGQYRVVVKDGKAESVAWSYDGTDADLENGDLTSPVWGQKQMEMALRNPQEASRISAPLYEDTRVLTVPVEEMEAGDAVWLGEIVHAAEPGAEELTREEAVEIARRALMEEFGLTEKELDGDVREPLFYTREDGGSIWTYGVYLVKDGVEMDLAVVVDGRTGEVLLSDVMTGGNG